MRWRMRTVADGTCEGGARAYEHSWNDAQCRSSGSSRPLRVALSPDGPTPNIVPMHQTTQMPPTLPARDYASLYKLVRKIRVPSLAHKAVVRAIEI